MTIFDQVTPDSIREASERLCPHILSTPIKRSDSLSRRFDNPVYLKLENLQRSGSFKIRGATNSILKNKERARENGVITASAGNHAQGVAYGARLVDCDALIVMAENTPYNKIKATETLGATVELKGDNYEDAYEAALKREEETGRLFIHPYDDPGVIEGQGTIGPELSEGIEGLAWCLIPVGGGGLFSGIALWMAREYPDVKLIPVQSALSSSLKQALDQKEPVQVPPPETMAEGMATGRVGDHAFQVIKEFAEDPILVDDDQIIEAILALLEDEKIYTEGAGAAPLAALLSQPDRIPDGPGCLMISGGNLDVLESLHFLERGLRSTGRLLRLATELTDRPGALSDLAGLIGEAGGNIQFIHHDRSDRRVAARRAKVHIEISVRNRKHGLSLLDRLEEADYPVEMLEL